MYVCKSRENRIARVKVARLCCEIKISNKFLDFKCTGNFNTRVFLCACIRTSKTHVIKTARGCSLHFTGIRCGLPTKPPNVIKTNFQLVF